MSDFPSIIILSDEEKAVGRKLERADIIALLEQAIDRCGCAITCFRCAPIRGVYNTVKAGTHEGLSVMSDFPDDETDGDTSED